MSWYENFPPNNDYWFQKEDFEIYIIDVDFFDNYLEKSKWECWAINKFKRVIFIKNKPFFGLIPNIIFPGYGLFYDPDWKYSFKMLLLTNSEAVFKYVIDNISKEATLVLATEPRGRINDNNSKLPPFIPDVYTYRDVHLRSLNKKPWYHFWDLKKIEEYSLLDFPQKKFFIKNQYEKQIIKFTLDILYYNNLHMKGLKYSIQESHYFSVREEKNVYNNVICILNKLNDISRDYFGIVIKYEDYEDTLYLCKYLVVKRIEELLKDETSISLKNNKEIIPYEIYIKDNQKDKYLIFS